LIFIVLSSLLCLLVHSVSCALALCLLRQSAAKGFPLPPDRIDSPSIEFSPVLRISSQSKNFPLGSILRWVDFSCLPAPLPISVLPVSLLEILCPVWFSLFFISISWRSPVHGLRCFGCCRSVGLGRGLISVVSCFGSFACTVQCSSVLNTVVPLDDWFSAQQLCDSFCT
jgi:hypothetical protein